MINVRGKWTFITGASRGIGRLSAVFMAKQGCNLILHSRKKEHLNDVINEIKPFSVDVFCVEAELSDLDSVEAMLNEIDSFGVNIEIVLNNAGLQIAYRTELLFLTTPKALK